MRALETIFQHCLLLSKKIKNYNYSKYFSLKLMGHSLIPSEDSKLYLHVRVQRVNSQIQHQDLHFQILQGCNVWISESILKIELNANANITNFG
jgi:hypothetical protein